MSFWKTLAKIGAFAAPIAAAPFTGGASLALIGAGAGAAEGALNGGGLKGALLGAGIGGATAGFIPGAGSKVANSGVRQAVNGVANRTLQQGGNTLARDLLIAGIPSLAQLAGAGIASRSNSKATQQQTEELYKAALMQDAQYQRTQDFLEKNHAEMTRDYAPFLQASQSAVPYLTDFVQHPPQVQQGPYGNSVEPYRAMTGGGPPPSLTALSQGPQGGPPVSTTQPVGGPKVRLVAPDGSTTREFAAHDPKVQGHMQRGWQRG